jgi:hypothetical protein
LLLIAARVSPRWGIAIVAIVLGLIGAGLFVSFYLRQPPSVERFRRLSACGFVSVGGLCLGSMVLVVRELPGTNWETRMWMLLGIAVVMMAGMAGFVIWHHLAVHNYERPRPGHPDFEEDAEGNPVRPNEPERE